jgi:hypothetical protein
VRCGDCRRARNGRRALSEKHGTRFTADGLLCVSAAWTPFLRMHADCLSTWQQHPERLPDLAVLIAETSAISPARTDSTRP